MFCFSGAIRLHIRGPGGGRSLRGHDRSPGQNRFLPEGAQPHEHTRSEGSHNQAVQRKYLHRFTNPAYGIVRCHSLTRERENERVFYKITAFLGISHNLLE